MKTRRLVIVIASLLVLLPACDQAKKAVKDAEQAAKQAEKAVKSAEAAVRQAQGAAEKLSTATGGDEAEASAGETKPKSLGEAMDKLRQQMAKATGREGLEPVNFRKLKPLLPEKFAGIKRTKHKGSTSGLAGTKVSVAEANYQTGKGSKRKVGEAKIMDFGTFLPVLAFAGWTAVEIDEESDDGYKRTYTKDGMKIFEEVSKSSKRAKVTVVVADRFLVELSGRGVSMDEVKEVLDDVDLKALDEMKDEGKKAADVAAP